MIVSFTKKMLTLLKKLFNSKKEFFFMKKSRQLLIILLCIPYVYADSTVPQIDKQKKSCIPCNANCNDNCNTDFNFECCRGPRGKRGRRGPAGTSGTGATGATGATGGCGVSEIWMNALQMAGCGEGPLWPTIASASPYGGCTAIPVWPLPNPLVEQVGGWGAFNIPNDLDNTKPVTIVAHLLISSTDGSPVGSLAALEVDIAYLTNNEIGGITPPATGYSDIEVSGDFTVTPPDTTGSSNVRQLSIPISLNPALIAPGDWAFVAIVRTPATTDEYENGISLSTVSLQYSRLCS